MRRHLKTTVGLLLSVLLLWWALRDVSAAEVAREIRDADPLLFAVSIALTIVGFAIRAVRWGVLLLPAAERVPYRPRYAAVIVGFAANNVLPARVGEIARVFTLTRLTRVPMGASVATLVIERLFDAVAVIGLLFASMAAPAFPLGEVGGVDPRAAARLIGLAMLGLGGLLFAMVAAPGRALAVLDALIGWALPDRVRERVRSAVEGFLKGLLVLRSGRLFVVSLVLAVGQWLVTGISFLLAFRAFEIEQVGFAGALFLQSLIALAVAIPSSPGFFGPWEAGAKLGLGLWGVSADKAISFAVGYHIGGFIPVTLMGIYYVWRLDLRWRDVRPEEDAPGDSSPVTSGPALREGV